jgi:3' terminal RNA ribose 2'-O-methyltransferase Hen1
MSFCAPARENGAALPIRRARCRARHPDFVNARSGRRACCNRTQSARRTAKWRFGRSKKRHFRAFSATFSAIFSVFLREFALEGATGRDCGLEGSQASPRRDPGSGGIGGIGASRLGEPTSAVWCRPLDAATDIRLGVINARVPNPRGRAAAMLLTITTTQQPATDLGFLLQKHPDRFHRFELSFGKAHVFYPEATTEVCQAALLLDVDPVGIVRGKGREHGLLSQYVNDRPYVASSFLSVAISRVYGSALQGRCRDRPELASLPLPLEARLDVLPVRGGERFLRSVFEPLSYAVDAVRHPLDVQFPEWGESSYFSVTIRKTTTLSELLTHLYVLVPVFDSAKHYFVGDDELEKLLTKGSGWLANHPEREEIARRYLKFQTSLFRQALARLVQDEEPDDAGVDDERPIEQVEAILEQPLSLNEQRVAVVLAALRASGAKRVLDLGCGEGKLLRELLKDPQFEAIVGLDVSIRALETARDRLRLDRLPERQAARISLIHGSLCYRDRRLEGFDAARPHTIVLTTPNREYNVKWENVGADNRRHPDHRFEWTRREFREWAETVAGRHGYSVRFIPVGPVDALIGSPTQMGVFERREARHG